MALDEDITQRRRQEQEITHLARHDALTNLANRALFREQLQQALLRLRARPGLCRALPRPRPLQERQRHARAPVGDALLQQVSERLLGCVRQGDVVARLGGDEFAIIQANVRDARRYRGARRRIVETVSKPYDIAGQRIDISTSIGMTLAPRDGADADQLMKNADLALYRAKADGRQRLLLLRAGDERSHPGAPQDGDRSAQGLRQRELALFYQPIICLETQRVTGFEALMRWTHPKRGAVPPAEFIAACRGDRADLGAGRVGAAAGPAPRRRAGRRRSRWRSTSRRCRSSAI